MLETGLTKTFCWYVSGGQGAGKGITFVFVGGPEKGLWVSFFLGGVSSLAVFTMASMLPILERPADPGKGVPILVVPQVQASPGLKTHRVPILDE